MSVCSSIINLNISNGPSALYPATYRTVFLILLAPTVASKANYIDTYNYTWAVEMHFINFFKLDLGEISDGWHFLIDHHEARAKKIIIFEAIYIHYIFRLRVCVFSTRVLPLVATRQADRNI